MVSLIVSRGIREEYFAAVFVPMLKETPALKYCVFYS